MSLAVDEWTKRLEEPIALEAQHLKMDLEASLEDFDKKPYQVIPPTAVLEAAPGSGKASVDTIHPVDTNHKAGTTVIPESAD